MATNPITGYLEHDEEPLTTNTVGYQRAPTPAETSAARAQGLANNQSFKWNGNAYEFTPLPAKEATTNTLQTGAAANSGAITAARTDATNRFTTAVAGMDTSGQFGAGTRQAPTVAQALASQSGSGIGNGGFTTGLTKPGSQPAIAQSSRDAATARAAPFTTNIDQGGGTVRNPSKVETAADQAGAALGSAPSVDMGVADRRLGEYQEALGMSREVIDRLLNGPNTANAIGARSLENQLAIARSARGGPGAVQQALNQAQQQAPQLQAQAAQQAQQEEMSKLTAAGSVAGNFAQAALGARGQDVDIAKKNVDSGLAIKNMIANLTGTQLELDQRNQELLGQMARDMAAVDFDWAQLSADDENRALDRYLSQYGIDANIAAQIKLAKQSGKMSLKDWVNAGVGVLGAGAGVVAAAIPKGT